jgi:hypothetical protein
MFEIDLLPTITFAPKPKLLQPNYFVTFSPRWPDNVGIKPGRTYQIVYTQQVDYLIKRTLPANDYADVNLSNENAGEKLYPEMPNSLNEIAVGMKEGNYVVHPMMPQNMPINVLEYSMMFVDLTDANKKYLGGYRPESSPPSDPRMRIYCVRLMDPFFLRIYVDTVVGYEKCILTLTINRCRLNMLDEDQARKVLERSKYIPYITEIARREAY